MADSQSDSSGKPKKKKQPYWLIYISLVVSGLLLIADAYNVTSLSKWTAQLGVTLLVSVGSLLIGNGRTAGYVAAAAIWIAVIAAWIL